MRRRRQSELAQIVERPAAQMTRRRSCFEIEVGRPGRCNSDLAGRLHHGLATQLVVGLHCCHTFSTARGVHGSSPEVPTPLLPHRSISPASDAESELASRSLRRLRYAWVGFRLLPRGSRGRLSSCLWCCWACS